MPLKSLWSDCRLVANWFFSFILFTTASERGTARTSYTTCRLTFCSTCGHWWIPWAKVSTKKLWLSPTARQPLVAAGPKEYLSHNCRVHRRRQRLLFNGTESCRGPHRPQERHQQPEVMLAATKEYLLALLVQPLWAWAVLPPSVRCAIVSTLEGQHRYSFQCGIMEGRFVHVVLPGLQKNLTVCGVQVYGTVLGKLHTPPAMKFSPTKIKIDFYYREFWLWELSFIHWACHMGRTRAVTTKNGNKNLKTVGSPTCLVMEEWGEGCSVGCILQFQPLDATKSFTSVL